MTRDYGLRSEGRRTLLSRLAVPAVALIIVIAGLALWWGQRQAAVDEARAWMISGPACPTVPNLAVIGFARPSLEDSQFDGVRIARAYGYVDCREIAERGGVPVCRFSSPGVLDVNGPGAHVIYWTKIAPATVIVEQGKPSCVLGAWPGFSGRPTLP